MTSKKPAAPNKIESLNEIQIVKIREIFSLFDKNSDGFVEISELPTMIRCLDFNPSLTEVEDIKEQIDPSHTGSFDQNALISWIAKNQKEAETLEDLKKAIASLIVEKNNDGNEPEKIAKDEILYELCTSGKGEPLEEHEFYTILRDGKFAGKEEISIDEFAKFLISR